MTAADQSPGTAGTEAGATGSSGPGGSDAGDLVAQIRQLAGSDPADVQRVVGDVLAALDRVTGGRLRDQLTPENRAQFNPEEPESPPVSGAAEAGRTGDPA